MGILGIGCRTNKKITTSERCFSLFNYRNSLHSDGKTDYSENRCNGGTATYFNPHPINMKVAELNINEELWLETLQYHWLLQTPKEKKLYDLVELISLINGYPFVAILS